MASLEAIQKTGIVRVPQPIKVINLPGGGAMFVMEYLKMKHLNKYVCVSLNLFTIFWGIFSYILQSENYKFCTCSFLLLVEILRVGKLNDKKLSILSEIVLLSVKRRVCMCTYFKEKI